MKSYKLIRLTALSLACAMMTACATKDYSNNVYEGNQVQRLQTVQMGVVEGIREVEIRKENTGVGTLSGAAIGGIAGSNIGAGKGSVVGSIVGAVAGGVAGQAIENAHNQKKGIEITVRLNNGDLRAIVQEATDEVFQVGQRVRVLSNAGVSRVTH